MADATLYVIRERLFSSMVSCLDRLPHAAVCVFKCVTFNVVFVGFANSLTCLRLYFIARKRREPIGNPPVCVCVPTESAYRLPESEAELPRIPVQPISAEDAYQILRSVLEPGDAVRCT